MVSVLRLSMGVLGGAELVLGLFSVGLELVVEHAVFGYVFVFCVGASVVGVGPDADAAARGEDACDFDVFGIHEVDEVFHDLVDAVFVEVSVVAVGEEVEFETSPLPKADRMPPMLYTAKSGCSS